MLKKSFLIFITLLPILVFGQSKRFLSFDPTGSYKFNEKTEKRDGETYGYFGEIKVKAIASSRIAISLWICKGAPSYNSGTVLDTLDFKENVATYVPEDDSTCRIVFTFKRKQIIVSQVQRDLNFGCGFGHGVFADGVYIKTSNKIPLIDDPAKG